MCICAILCWSLKTKKVNKPNHSLNVPIRLLLLQIFKNRSDHNKVNNAFYYTPVVLRFIIILWRKAFRGGRV